MGAFNTGFDTVNLHRPASGVVCTAGDGAAAFSAAGGWFRTGDAATVGRCGLTVSNPVLKAPMDSALETKI